MRVLVNVAGGHSHLYLVLPIAQALQERGHEVRVALPRQFRDSIAGTGLTPVLLDPAEIEEPLEHFRRRASRLPQPQRARATIARYLEQAVLVVPELQRVLSDRGADVVIRETSAWGAWLAGELSGIPVVDFDFAPTPTRIMAAAMGDLFDRARTRVGLPPDPSLTSLHKWLHLLGGPASWFSPRSIGPTTRIFGPPGLAGPEDEPIWLATFADSSKLVYLTLGTMFDDTPGAFEAVFEAVAARDIKVIATVGPRANGRLFDDLPPNVRVERFLPQSVESTVINRSETVICHGGYGTLMRAMQRARPVVCMPLAGADNALHAERVRSLGIGVVVPEEERSVAAISGALDRVLTESHFSRAARQMADEISELPPLTDSASLIEHVANEREPIDRLG